MKLYNTLTRQVEEIKPLNPAAVTIYTCGPTVYDYPHIGNWFTFIRYDLLIRTLKASGFEPKWVMNITNVGHLVSDADEGEDKLEKGALREGKSAWDIAKHYGDYFIEGLKRLNFITPTELPKATDHIREQIDFISQLESKGYTYVIDDGVYYDTAKFEGYSSFARLDLDDQQAGARVAVNHQKRNPVDFALWKFSPTDHKRDMEWDSPWGKGFPGWHIECSAMARKYLGDTIDIHAGGIDHVPVHHTNEIAQSEAVTDKRFAQYWMHTNHILTADEKISKSLGNTTTLEDIEKHGFSLPAFRLLVLESHYRSQSKFSWEALEAAQSRLKGLQAMADLRWQIRSDTSQTSVDYQKYQQAMTEALKNDLNTPQALAILSEAEASSTNPIVDSGEAVQAFNDFLKAIDDNLGLELLNSPDISDDQKALIDERESSRQTKDFTKSDKLRQQLEDQGIGLRDTPLGPVWFRL